MTTYRFLYADVMTDSMKGELPLSDLRFGEVLNGPGSLSASLPLQSDVSGTELTPGKTAIYIERDGVLVWGGVLWTMTMDVEQNAATLGAEGFWSLIRRRRITNRLTYTSTDQVSIAAAILANLKAKPGGDHLITSVTTATGVARTATYEAWERKNAAEAIEELAASRDGFDFRVAVRWSAFGTPAREFITSFPSTGRRTDVVLDVGTNAELLSVDVDATNVTTTAHVKGTGEGSDARIATVSTSRLLGVYPLLEDLNTYSDISNMGTLEAKARFRLDRGSEPLVVPSVTLYPGREPFLGSFVVGDQVRVRCSYGLIQVDDYFRITAWDATVDDSGEAITLTLAPLNIFTES